MLIARNKILALAHGTTLSALLALGCGGTADPDPAVSVAAASHHPHPGGGTGSTPDGGTTGTSTSSTSTGAGGGTTGSSTSSTSTGAGGATTGSSTSTGTGGATSGDAGAPPPPAGLSLRVVGKQLVDANNAVVRLLGVDRSGQEFECIQGGTPGLLGWGLFDGPTDLASAQAIASWHATAVRLPLNEDCWLGINGVNPLWGGAAYRAAIQSYVATLHQAGLYVIVDLHWNAPGGVPAASQQPLPDADHAVDFWTSVASAFASDPATVLDLYNEPFLYGSYMQNPAQDPWDCWLNGCGLNQYLTGGSPYTLPLAWNAVGMQALVDAVRATGATNPIMVGGLGWANDLSGWLTHMPQDPEQALIASWHSYPGEGCASASCWDATIAPVAAVVPVVTGEVGDSVCTPATYVPALLPWADAQGISYLGWTWNTWGDCSNVLISDYTGTPTANYGQAFQSLLMASHP
jgi:endoglucanase